jgi:hypothetical protein
MLLSPLVVCHWPILSQRCEVLALQAQSLSRLVALQVHAGTLSVTVSTGDLAVIGDATITASGVLSA